MRNYDFSILSPFEFENITRDILRKRDSIDYGTFAEGPDGGIDIRASLAENGKIIAQAKRYKKYSQLKSSLKKEVDKVKKNNPDRYIISTSVDLTPDNKDQIIKLFNPYIKNESDILGRQDLNKYIGDYKNIEDNYYKLWLTSTSVFNRFLNKKIVNSSDFELKEIKETVQTYVINTSFDKALKTLLENRYVIISGIPGIGKTTLARMLTYIILSKKYGYDKFYYIADNIDDAYQIFENEEKQIFFFDDFLGSTRFKNSGQNFDSKLVKFIHEIKRHNNKLFILTTREYILNDAKKYYDKFDNDDIELAKCIIDMGDYTKFIKGQILYNHLVDSNLNPDYIKAIKENKNYMRLIEHKNFNPRIIETIIKQSIKETCSPNEYFQKIMAFFDYPKSVWEKAYDQLSITAREMLQVLASMAPPVMYKDWEKAYNSFFNNVHSSNGYLDEKLWQDNVKSLSNCFIKIDSSNNEEFLNYHNPSIKDFIIHLITTEKGIQERLIHNAYYVEQIYSIFTDGSSLVPEIKIDSSLYDIVLDAFNLCWNNFYSCKIFHYSLKKGNFIIPDNLSKPKALYCFISSFRNIGSSRSLYIKSKITSEMLLNNNLSDSLLLLQILDVKDLNIDTNILFENYKERLSDSDDCIRFLKLLDTIFLTHKGYKDSSEFHNKLDDVVFKELETRYMWLDKIVNSISQHVPSWDTSKILENIENKKKSSKELSKTQVDNYENFYHEVDKDISEKELIDNLFNTLQES